jgi:hypothetical protein
MNKIRDLRETRKLGYMKRIQEMDGKSRKQRKRREPKKCSNNICMVEPLYSTSFLTFVIG